MRKVLQSLSVDELQLLSELRAGRTAVANGHTHKALIAWAMAEDLARYITAYRPKVTPWGNPFRPRGAQRGVAAAHALASARYRDYLSARPDRLAAVQELCGKLLICYCKPLPCHGDVLAEICNTAVMRGDP